jgi:hypothetical protein
MAITTLAKNAPPKSAALCHLASTVGYASVEQPPADARHGRQVREGTGRRGVGGVRQCSGEQADEQDEVSRQQRHQREETVLATQGALLVGRRRGKRG